MGDVRLLGTHSSSNRSPPSLFPIHVDFHGVFAFLITAIATNAALARSDVIKRNVVGSPALGIYLDKTIIQKDTCTPMFIAALFEIGKTWKQPKRPSTEKWIKNLWSSCTMEYHSAMKSTS